MSPQVSPQMSPAAIAVLHQGSFEPWLLACRGLSGGLYVAGLARLWRHAGWSVLCAALVTPLDALGGELFSAHMIQHELLMVVAAPLLVAGRPLALWAWALPAPMRRAVGRLFRSPRWRGPWRILTGAFVAWLLHALALWIWHVPTLFEAALADEGVHVLQHSVFLGTALLFWWSVSKTNAHRDQGWALISIFTTMVHSGALGALLTFSAHAWYPAYSVTAPSFGLDPLQDQQLGGLIMWIPAGMVYVGCALVVAGRWLARNERAGPSLRGIGRLSAAALPHPAARTAAAPRR